MIFARFKKAARAAPKSGRRIVQFCTRQGGTAISRSSDDQDLAIGQQRGREM